MKPFQSIRFIAFVGIVLIAISGCILRWSDRPLGTSVAGYLEVSGAAASPSPPVTATDDKALAEIQQAGQQADTAQIPRMIQALKTPPHPNYLKTALHSLSQLGATEALPAIDVVLQTGNDPDTRNYAVVAKARLQAEAAAQSIQDSKTGAQTKVKVFYQTLGMSVTDLNKGLAQRQDLINRQAFRIQPTIVVYAVRELADIVYSGRYADFAALPGIADINFAQDYPSALKMRLASFPSQARINTLVQELSHSANRTMNSYYDLQLLSNGGLPASEAAATQLQEMDLHRDQYVYVGFASLFDVIRGTGDKSKAPLVDKFRHDVDSRIAHYAAADYYDIEDGVKHQYVPGY